MLATQAGSRNIYRCLSSAFGSFWRAAKRNSPESAQRVAKLKLILNFSVRDRAPTWNHFDRLEGQTNSKAVSPRGLRPLSGEVLLTITSKVPKSALSKQAAGTGDLRPEPRRRNGILPRIKDCGC
jgi:hypothetical protein